MDVLPKHFLVYKYFDMWSENNENLKYLKKFNKYLTGFGLLHYLFTAIGVVLHLSSDISEVSEVLYMLISVIGATIRFFFIIYHQESLMSIIKDYRLPSCQRKSAEEKVIYKKYQGAAFFDWVFLIVSTVMVGTLISLGPLFIRVNGEMQLPLPSYNILGLPDKIFFYSTYVLQVTMLHQATCIGISFDILVHSFLILAAGQLEILKHRFQSLNLNQENVIDRLIEHHLIIQRIISKVQKTFMGVIAIIFAMSFESFCTSIFQLTQKKVTTYAFWIDFIYLSAILMQAFFFCWFGNEVQEKSKSVADGLYFSKWLTMDSVNRKKILLIMLRAHKTIPLSYYGQITLSVNTFFYILKTAYGVFNILRQNA